MSADPKNTGIPYLVNQNLFSTLDFLIAATNMDALIKKFPNEICVAYLYNYTKTTNDPIRAQAEFFNAINKNLLNLKNNPNCTKNKYVKQYNFIKANLDISEEEELAYDSAGNNITRINEQTKKLEILVWSNFDHNITRWIEFLQDITSEVDSILNTVENNYGEASLTEEFCLYWIDVFNRSVQQVKDEYYKIDTSYERGIFQELSDSIRLYTRYKENYDVVNGTLMDPYYENTGLLPRHYPSVIGDKLDNEFQKLIIEFSQKTSFLHRKNLKTIYTNLPNKFPSTTSHGSNLITDDKYYEDIGKISPTLIGTVADYLNLGSKIFEYRVLVGQSSNEQEITKAIFNKIVQDTSVEMDFWQQVYTDINNPKTTKLLLDKVN